MADQPAEPVDSGRHIGDGRHAVYGPRKTPLAVIGDQRGGLLAIGPEPVMQNLGDIVLAQRFAARLHLGNPAFDPPHQGILVDPQFDHGVEPEALSLQKAVERRRLWHGARETVENKAFTRVRFVDALADDTNHESVGTKPPRAMISCA